MGYNKTSKLGIVAIDLNKVFSPKVDQALQFNKFCKDIFERIAYQRAVWSQEVSVRGYIPMEAIIGYVP